MGHTWMWLDGFEWRGIRTKQFTYAVTRIDREEFFFDNLKDPLQKTNLAKHPEHAREKERIKTIMTSRMADLKDEFRECSWYGQNWTENRRVLRGAKG
jgi:arylsulfatase A-like enzyme